MKSIGTPNRWFYTGIPPRLLGGSGSKICRHISQLLRREIYFRAKEISCHTPLGYSKKNSRQQEKMQDKIPEISKEKQKLLFRIKRIRGQFAAVERVLTSGPPFVAESMA